MTCNQCNGPLEETPQFGSTVILGQLGGLFWARCRHCGADQTVPGQDNIEEEED
jgi:hypothetical protein